MEFEPAIAELLAAPSAVRVRQVLRGAYPDGIIVEVRRYGETQYSTHAPPLIITIRLPGTVMTATLFTGSAGVQTHLAAQGLPVQAGEWTVVEWGRRR